jgi:hypothetical protein
VQKKVPGTRFNDLEMITKLLTPPGSWELINPTEELDSGFDTPVLEGAELDSGKPLASSRFDWRIPQKVPEEENHSVGNVSSSVHKYGFGLQQHGVFRGLTEELRLVLDIKDIDSLTPDKVRATREDMELEAFDEEHYLYVNQAINQEINQSTNQPINRSTDQPINRSTDHPII